MQQIISLFVLSFSLIFVSGCGSSDEEPTLPQAQYIFLSEGEYQIDQYLFPEEDQAHVYQITHYTDERGTGEYGDDSNSSYFSAKYLHSENSISYMRNDTELIRYSIHDTNVTMIDQESNRTIDIVRYIDIPNYLIKVENNRTVEAGQEQERFVCQLTKDLGYREILDSSLHCIETTCTLERRTSGVLFGDKPYETTEYGTYIRRYAKGLGLYYNEEDICEVTTFNGVTEKSCQKDVTELIQSLSL